MKMNRRVKKYIVLFIWTASCILNSCGNKRQEKIAENEFYTCSMDPQVMEKQPGICPICKMELTKIVIDRSQASLVKLSEEQIKLGNIKTDTVRQGNTWNEKT